MATGDKLVTLDGLKAVYDKKVAPVGGVARLYPFNVPADTVIYNQATAVPVYAANVTYNNNTIGAGIKKLRIVTGSDDDFYIHSFYCYNSNKVSSFYIRSVQNGDKTSVLLQKSRESKPTGTETWDSTDDTGFFTTQTVNGDITVEAEIDWSLVNASNWSNAGNNANMKKLVTVSEGCIIRTHNTRIAELEDAVAELAELIGG